MHPRPGRLAGTAIARAEGELAHRAFPAAIGDRHPADLATVGFEQGELWQSALVHDEGDPFIIRRPARVKRVVLEEGELVGLSADRRLDIEIVELVGGAAGGRVDEPLPIACHVRPGAIERLLPQDRGGVADASLHGRHADRVARAERYRTVRDQQQLVAFGEPGRREVHVPGAEIQPVAAEGVVGRERHLVAGPPTLVDRSHRHVEVAVRSGRHIRDAVAGGGERRVAVDVRVVGQRPGLAGLDLEQLQLHPRAVVVGGVDDPPAVGRPVG